MIWGAGEIAKAACWVALAFAVIFGIDYIVGKIHDDGRKVERAVWEHRAAEQSKQVAKAVSEAAKAWADQRDAEQKNLLGVLDEKSKDLATKDKLIAGYVASGRGLWVYTKDRTCPSPGENPSETHPVGVAISGAPKEELFEGDQRFLRSIGDDADTTVAYYDALRKACRPLVQVEK